jgi:hypothetical protein
MIALDTQLGDRRSDAGARHHLGAGKLGVNRQVVQAKAFHREWNLKVRPAISDRPESRCTWPPC